MKFTVEDTGEIQKVVMKDEVKPEETPTPETPSTQVTDTPKTGDDTHMLIWILLAIAGMAGSVSAVWTANTRRIPAIINNILILYPFHHSKGHL